MLTVIGRDVGCCKISTIWRQAASSMSRLAYLINWNKANSMFTPSLNWKLSCRPYKMTPFLGSVSCTIQVISGDKHHQTSFRSKNILFIRNMYGSSAVVNFDHVRVRKHTTSDRLSANQRTVGNPCNLLLYAG